MNQTLSMQHVLRAAREQLADAGVKSPQVDAELLAQHVTGLDRTGLFLATQFPQTKVAEFWELIEQRSQRVPLQHLTGETGFRFLTLAVEAGVFIPRPETELVAQQAIERAQPEAQIVDLCTGAGGIAIACAYEIPDARVWAVDANPQAVELTQRNAERNGVKVQAIHSDVRTKSLLEEQTSKFDIVISNPPYIPFDAEPVDIEVSHYDPPLALYGGGEDGLEVPRAVIDAAYRLLKPGGLLVVEHGDEQGAAMRHAVQQRGGFTHVRTEKDLTNRDRMVIAHREEVAD